MDFPFTPDLEQLVDIAQDAGITIPDDLCDIGGLTPYTVQSRYPGFWGEITDSELDEALTLAEGALGWAATLIGASIEGPQRA